jgi:predicted RNA-binding protein with TRAM domain
MDKTKIPFSTSERILLEIEGLNHAGEGVSHIDGFTALFPGLPPAIRLKRK